MRNISFALTTRQFRDRSKTVTRRVGWGWLKPGDELMGVVTVRGVKPGEKVERLGPVRVVSVRRERLDAVSQVDVVREGYPELCPADFLRMFCNALNCSPSQVVTRIEFEYLDPIENDSASGDKPAARPVAPPPGLEGRAAP